MPVIVRIVAIKGFDIVLYYIDNLSRYLNSYTSAIFTALILSHAQLCGL